MAFRRIVSLDGGVSEILFALGLGSRVVGRDVSTTFPEAADIPLVTLAHDVSAEAVLSLEPDLVLALDDTGPAEALAQVRAAGVEVVIVDRVTDVDRIGARIVMLGDVIGMASRAYELAVSIERRLADITAEPSGRRPRVAFLYMRGNVGVSLLGGPGSGADSVITAAGGIDAGTELGLDRAFTPLTSEALVAAAPDVILMTTTGLESVGGVEGLLTVPGIAQTPAGRDRRIVTEEDGLLYSFGVRTPDAVAALARRIRA